MTTKPNLLVVSHVFPFPRSEGQQQRVYYKLINLRKAFHVTFLTFAPIDQRQEIETKLKEYCDDVIVMPSRYHSSRRLHQIRGLLYALRTGLKRSNYRIGELEFAPARIERALQGKKFDLALYEYWHAVKSVSYFQSQGTLCVLDMHDVLWQSYKSLLTSSQPLVPGWWKQRQLAKYRAAEEKAWGQFDLLIAINSGEAAYARSIVGDNVAIVQAGMGTDLAKWAYSWEPVSPPRLAFYGGMGSLRNQQDALLCHNEIMPRVWDVIPDAELWIVGSNPPAHIRELATDPRVEVTGFVEDVASVLKTMHLVLCPWSSSGVYGFRSRVIEVMALGVPIIVNPGAIYGMEFDIGHGIFSEPDAEGMAQTALRLAQDSEELSQQSRAAREQIEKRYGIEATYGYLTGALFELSQFDFAQPSGITAGLDA